ncbi:MAG: ABC transporter permease [Ectothiorhodospiraceae bacterium]|nr:ABC transporter permease [Ectothiorhodospiraceae bacterium]
MSEPVAMSSDRPAAPVESTVRPLSPWRRLLRDKVAVAAGAFLVLVVLAAIFAPLLAPADPYDNNIRLRLKPPGGDFVLGTDTQGRDMVTRLLYGTRTTLVIGVSAVLMGGFIGALMGIMAAYYRRLENLLMRIVDILLSFPSILFGLAIAALLGPGVDTLIVALTVSAIPSVARVTRGAATVVMQQDYLEAGRAVGVRERVLIWRYLTLNCLSTILVYLTLQFGQTILLGAALSFLGLGAQPPIAELGTMAAEGRNFLSFRPHVATIPSVAIFLIVLAANLLGDAMRDVLDPRMRQ